MKPQKQLVRHEPELGRYGDCHRTAMACLLDLEVEEAPHFIGAYEVRKRDMEAEGHNQCVHWQDEQEAWLNTLGYTAVDICWNGSIDVEELFNFMRIRNPNIYYILGGTSPRNTNHSVICLGGQFEWDPHPDGGFLVGPMDNDMWEVTFILPVSMRKF